MGMPVRLGRIREVSELGRRDTLRCQQGSHLERSAIPYGQQVKFGPDLPSIPLAVLGAGRGVVQHWNDVLVMVLLAQVYPSGHLGPLLGKHASGVFDHVYM